MPVKIITEKPAAHEKYLTHPLQSWEWGNFREDQGINVVRFEQKTKNGQQNIFQMTVHQIPRLPFFIGYIPKSNLPNGNFLEFLEDYAKQKRIIFVKFEPNVTGKGKNKLIIGKYSLLKSSRALFTKYTFQIDLTKTESELLKNMNSKTRYNVRLAQKKGVKVIEDNSDKLFETYLKLQRETTRRQKFFAHNEQYHRQLWQTLHQAKIAYLLHAEYKREVLASWMVFLFNNCLYYPYGGSSLNYRNLMPSNLILWEAMLWGKKHQAKIFDLWGSLGPNPDISDPWYGFHRFKEGYGGRLVEFIGSYDFVINPTMYRLYNLAESIRWKILNSLQ